jgi:hypothetical protein
MSLAQDYCREIAKELRQTAVYIPGSDVKPGDIIKFTNNNIFDKPIGEFYIAGNLSDFGINLPTESEEDNATDSYVYASKGSVSVSFTADLAAPTVGQGKLSIGFSKSGSTYLSAIDCKETRFKSILNLENDLAPHRGKLQWNEYYIVISVTIASKAIIMQSNSSSASLEIDGSVKNLVPGGDAVRNLNADFNLKISKYKDASFIKEWSNNVPVFFTLVKYKKKFLGGWDINSKKMSYVASNLTEDVNNPYVIEVINPM